MFFRHRLRFALRRFAIGNNSEEVRGIFRGWRAFWLALAGFWAIFSAWAVWSYGVSIGLFIGGSLTAIVVAHEGGHYLADRIQGRPVQPAAFPLLGAVGFEQPLDLGPRAAYGYAAGFVVGTPVAALLFSWPGIIFSVFCSPDLVNTVRVLRGVTWGRL